MIMSSALVHSSVESLSRKAPRVPASPLLVKDAILEILNSTEEPLKREEIIQRLCRIMPARGFKLSPDTAEHVTKKALKILREENQVTTPRVGWYSLSARSVPAEAGEENIPDLGFEEVEEPEPKLKVMRLIGEGPQSVYLYFHEAHVELANSKRQAAWECKVGWTIGEPTARIIGQGALTCFPRPPVIGLVIRTHDGRNLERLLHAALSYAGAKIEEGGGSEWFVTSPALVEQWFLEFSKTVVALKPA
jgi:hypothetical protein